MLEPHGTPMNPMIALMFDEKSVRKKSAADGDSNMVSTIVTSGLMKRHMGVEPARPYAASSARMTEIWGGRTRKRHVRGMLGKEGVWSKCGIPGGHMR
eukprot:101062-Chlamydomonas_euryale.AAC.2